MSSARYLVGIDLGTTNSAVATVDTSKKVRSVDILPIRQLVAAGESAPRTLLPSAAYLPAQGELPDGALKLPWGEERFPVGVFAREQGARVPGRVVTSAKSWLCHPGVDRTAPILPWGAPADVPRMSPVEASARYLKHLAAAWSDAHPGEDLADQEVVLTVPASFDEAARELTVEAAKLAGLPPVTLIEEPLAAFYHWLEGHSANLAKELDGISLVLVVDVGGGTTDLTLIQASAGDDGLRLDRTAVGDHLLLGGDNVDLAIAKIAEARLGGGALDAASWGALVLSARGAKEALLAPEAPESRSVAILGRSSKLLGGTRKVDLTRDEVRKLVLDGFFPQVPADSRPDRRSGLRELGLPYASDAAVTKHVAAFLQRHLLQGQYVDAVLFNGGALTPTLVTDRLLDVLESWSGRRPKVLRNDHLDEAVARGAAHFGLVRRGEGVRVGGGSARAYFLGVATSEGHQAVCVIPRGLAEGTTVTLPDREFALTTGRPVRFDLYSSTARRAAKPGAFVTPEGSEDLLRLPPIQTVVRSPGGAAELAVHVESGMTEIGTLALFCVAGKDRFKLEFQLRGASDDDTVYETTALPRRFEEARTNIDFFFGRKPAADVDPRDVKNLSRSLEKVIGERDSWNLPMLRELWSSLWAGVQKRRRSAEHERQWLMLTGYALRPGFGAPLDDWRARETFGIFGQGLQFHQDKAQWDQWWILWRRVAGGLDDEAQRAIADFARPWLEPPPAGGKTRPRPKGPKVEGLEELVRLVASLERLPLELKLEVAEWLWARLAAIGGSVWTLGRLGTRVPFHGSAHLVVPADTAAVWIERILGLDWTRVRDAPFALAMLARATGDRARDVPDELRTKVADRLVAAKANEQWVRLVREPVALAASDESRFFGDTLPVGLKLVR